MTMSDPTTPPSRRVIATIDRYNEAEAMVDRLADEGFPVEHVSIVGRDLQYVENVVGALNFSKVALGGALSGVTMGALFGLLFGALFAHDGTSLLGIVAYWVLTGAVVGAAIALFIYGLSGGKHDFSSTKSVQAKRYDVVVDESCRRRPRPPVRRQLARRLAILKPKGTISSAKRFIVRGATRTPSPARRWRPGCDLLRWGRRGRRR